MSGLTMNYKKYYDYVNKMTPPVMPSELPPVRMRLRDMAAYARKKGVRVTELSEEERNSFIEKINKKN